MNLAEYAEQLSRDGVLTLPGAFGTFWMRHESFALVRLPTFDLSVPEPAELRRVLWRGHAAVAGYVVQPDELHPPNAYWYVCEERGFDLGSLNPKRRNKVRQSLRNLGFSFVDGRALVDKGLPAFAETRCRNGLSDGNQATFRARFVPFCNNAAHRILGAWSGDRLVGFLSIVVVDDWVEIEGSFAETAFMHLRPADGLVFHTLRTYLKSGSVRLVSFGTSSIQEDTHAEGLHDFKVHAGFDARPVHRTFACHPWLRPFANRLSLAGLHGMLKLRPSNRCLRKAAGVLAEVIGGGKPDSSGGQSDGPVEPPA